MGITQWLLLAILLVLILIGLLTFFGRSLVSFGLNQTRYKIRLVGHQNKELAQAKRLPFINQATIDKEHIELYESNKQRYAIPIGDITSVSVKHDYDKVFDKRFWVRLSYNLGRADIIYTQVNKSLRDITQGLEQEKELTHGPKYQITLFFFSEEDEKSFFSNINDKITDFNNKVINQLAVEQETLGLEEETPLQNVCAGSDDENIVNSSLDSNEETGIDKQIVKIIAMDIKEQAGDYLEGFINVIDKEFFYLNLGELEFRLNQQFIGSRVVKNDQTDLFLEGELLPFIDILQENNQFKWIDRQHMLALLELMKDIAWGKIYREFLDKTSSGFGEAGSSEEAILSNYILLFGDKSVESIPLEALRVYLEQKGLVYSANELENKVLVIKKGKQLDLMKRKLQAQVQESSGITYSFEDIDTLSGERLKDFVIDLFRQKAYKINRIKDSDYEVELIISKGLRKVAIIAKFNSGCIGKGTLQQVLSLKSANLCQEAILITNSFFSNAAMSLGDSNKVELWDRETLRDKMNNSQEKIS